ncbi:type II secretion system protein F [Gordonia sp. VNK1]|jgi:tight adherence protein B|uniref:type II secretion system F family protein n=1 Tax=Gordonia oleivorans TaxID=3156618 RepID=UPI0032B47812
MTPVLLALACAVLWSGRPRAAHRLQRIRLASRSSVPAFARWPIVMLGLGAVAVIGGVAPVIAAGIVAGVAWWLSRHRRRLGERAHHRDELLTALTLMIAELSVGAPPARACSVAAQEMSTGTDGTSTVAAALSVLAGRAELGGTIVVDADAGTDDESWNRIAIAWQTADRYGLPLAELLDSVRADLVERRGFDDRTRAGLAGPRATASVLAVLPLLGIALGQATGARPVQILTGGGLGGVLLVVGAGLVAAGLVWSERISDKVITR